MSRLIDADALIEFCAERWIPLNIDAVNMQPTIQPKKAQPSQEGTTSDLISRTETVEHLRRMLEATVPNTDYDEGFIDGVEFGVSTVSTMPSAQPERTCVNCGRTVNNGGWYADGRTRCPIEEHYALPKDGFCHLWEERNITDDDYPERRTDD